MARPKARSWLTFAALLLCAAFGAHWLGQAVGRLGTQRADSQFEVIEGLAVEKSALDLGEVWEEKDFVCEVPIENRNSVDRTIEDFHVSCGCTSVEPRTVTIPAGKTARIRLKVDLAERTLRETGLNTRQFAVQLRPMWQGAPRNQPSWEVHGIVASRVTLDVLNNIQFGDAPVSGQPPPIRRVKATIHVHNGQLQVSVNPGLLTARMARLPGSSIAPKSTLAPGPFNCTINFQASL